MSLYVWATTRLSCLIVLMLILKCFNLIDTNLKGGMQNEQRYSGFFIHFTKLTKTLPKHYSKLTKTFCFLNFFSILNSFTQYTGPIWPWLWALGRLRFLFSVVGKGLCGANACPMHTPVHHGMKKCLGYYIYTKTGPSKIFLSPFQFFKTIQQLCVIYGNYRYSELPTLSCPKVTFFACMIKKKVYIYINIIGLPKNFIYQNFKLEINFIKFQINT